MPIKDYNDTIIGIYEGTDEIKEIRQGDVLVWPIYDWSEWVSKGQNNSCFPITNECNNWEDVGNVEKQCIDHQSVVTSTVEVYGSCTVESSLSCNTLGDHGNAWVSGCTYLRDDCNGFSETIQSQTGFIYSTCQSTFSCNTLDDVGNIGYDCELGCYAANWELQSADPWTTTVQTIESLGNCDCGLLNTSDSKTITRPYCVNQNVQWVVGSYSSWQTNTLNGTPINEADCDECSEVGITDNEVESRPYCLDANTDWNETGTYGLWSTTVISGSLGSCNCVDIGNSDQTVETRPYCNDANMDWIASGTYGSWSTSYKSGSLGSCSDCDLDSGTVDSTVETRPYCSNSYMDWVQYSTGSWTTSSLSGSLGSCYCSDENDTDSEVETRVSCQSASWVATGTYGSWGGYVSGSLGTCSCSSGGGTVDFTVETRTVCGDVSWTETGSVSGLDSCSGSFDPCSDCGDINNERVTCSQYIDGYHCVGGMGGSTEFECTLGGGSWEPDYKYTKTTDTCVQSSTTTQYREKWWSCVENEDTEYRRLYFRCTNTGPDTEYRYKYWSCQNTGPDTEYRYKYWQCNNNGPDTEYRWAYYSCQNTGPDTEYQRQYYSCETQEERYRHINKTCDCTSYISVYLQETSTCEYYIEEQERSCQIIYE